jgi:hypothetical protein
MKCHIYAITSDEALGEACLNCRYQLVNLAAARSALVETEKYLIGSLDDFNQDIAWTALAIAISKERLQ